MNMLKVKLTAAQTEGLPFPIGCPVWYNFPEKSSGCREAEDPPILKQGVVNSVFLNLGAKDMIYEVVYEYVDEKETIVDEVSQHNMAYGANCPVTVSIDPNRDDEGIILFCETSPSDPGKFLYTVMILMEGSQARYESRIDAERVKYRKVKVETNTSTAETAAGDGPSAAAGAQKEQPAAVHDPPASKISASASAAHSGEGKVPSSITCAPVSKSSGNKRKHLPDNASTLTSPSDSQYKQDCRRSIDSSSKNDVDRWKGKGNHDAMLEIKTPFWLQIDRTVQKSLYFHLIGSKHNDKQWKRSVKDIEGESNCGIRVNFVDKGKERGFRPPITITVVARSRTSGARDVHLAREKIQDLLLDFVRGDGSRGRLLYDLASSCGGDHRPMGSLSRCVRGKDPFAEDGEDGREVFMTLVHLPFEVVGGQKKFHVDFLLTSSLLTYLWNEMDCYVKAVCNGSGIPVRRCYPYLLVMGKSWRDVDRAVETMNEAAKKHADRCTCKFNKLNNHK